jgi:hypothetical protein
MKGRSGRPDRRLDGNRRHRQKLPLNIGFEFRNAFIMP